MGLTQGLSFRFAEDDKAGTVEVALGLGVPLETSAFGSGHFCRGVVGVAVCDAVEEKNRRRQR